MGDNLPPLLPPQLRVAAVVRPAAKPPPLPLPTRRPGVILAYRWWCGFFALLYLAMAVSEILVACGAAEPSLGLFESFVSADDPQKRAEIIAEKRAEAPYIAAFMVGIGLLYIAAATLRCLPGRWSIGLVVICTTVFPFCITVAGVVPLLVYWTKPETKRYFEGPA
jgi:hypothetical protein